MCNKANEKLGKTLDVRVVTNMQCSLESDAVVHYPKSLFRPMKKCDVYVPKKSYVIEKLIEIFNGASFFSEAKLLTRRSACEMPR